MKDVHVASIRLYVADTDIDSVAAYVKWMKFGDLVQIDRRHGNLTLVMEADTVSDVTRAITLIDQHDGVAHVCLVFHNVIARQDSNKVPA